MRSWRGWPVAVVMVSVVGLASCGGSTAGGSDAATASAGGDEAASLALPDTAGPGRAIATFAGGCFWCTEADFEKLPGVLAAVSGYTGGESLNPTYEQVGGGRTGHAEAVRITYDPSRVSYATLLDYFWRHIDPTQSNGQFCDRGRQYRSAIFTHDSTQRALAEASKRALAASRVLPAPIVTEIAPAGPFYAAEAYHQDYYKKNAEDYHRYREGCGRDRRLQGLWGKEARVSPASPSSKAATR